MNSDRIEASFDVLFGQAKDTADEYLRRAIGSIDGMLGAGYAAKHPELIAAYMNVAAADFGVASSMKVIGSALDRVADSIQELKSDE